MDLHEDSSSKTLSPTKKTALFPPQPTYNPSIAPPFSKPSLESMATTVHQTASTQDIPIHQEEKDYDPTSTDPFSAFYSHPTTRTSLEQAKSESKIHIKIYEHDLEAGSRVTTQSHHTLQDLTTIASTTTPPRQQGLKKQCTMWPAHSQLQRKKNNVSGTIRGSRACAPYRGLTKKQRLVLQIILAILVVGAATGLGIGISKAVGAGVWKSNNAEAPIGDSDGS